MGVVFHPRSMDGRPLARRSKPWSSHDGLPSEVAFLREYGVSIEHLKNAALDAFRQGVDAREALLAGGGITDTLYYRSLARHLDMPFRTDLPSLDPRANALRALRDGRVRLADGTWLLAPTGAALGLLLAGARAPDALPRRVAITTPAHLEALVLRRAGASLARRASQALPVLQPDLSARGALDKRSAGVALCITVAVAALFVLAPTILALLVGALFLAAVGFRCLVCAAGLSDRPRDREPPRQADSDLPRYTVLVPLPVRPPWCRC